MKRFTLLSLLVLLCTAVAGAQTSQLAPDEITAGKRIVLRTLSTTNSLNHFAGAGPATALSSACLFTVEDGGDGTFLLRQENPASDDAAYLKAPAAAAENVVMGTAAEAAHVTFADLTDIPCSDQDYMASELNEKTLRVCVTLAGGSVTYLNCQKEGTATKFAAGTASWSIWNVYEVPAYLTESAQALISEAEALPSYLFYPEELVDALKEALDKDAETLLTAIENYNAQFAPTLKPGYYTLQTQGRQNNNYMSYVTGNNPISGAAGVSDLRGVWNFERLENGKYTVQNAYTGTYMAMPTTSQPVQLSESPVEMALQVGGTLEGSENCIAFGGGSGNTMAHLDGSSHVVGWNTNALATFWQPTAVDETLLASYTTAAASALFDARTVGCVGGPTAQAAAPILEAIEAFEGQTPTLEGFYQLRETVEECMTFEPEELVQVVDGALYRIQNYQRKTSTGNTACNGEGGYIEPIDQLKPAHSVSVNTAFAAVDQNEASADALWQLQAAGDGVYRLYNPNSGFYMKQQAENSQAITSTTNAEEAATFSFGTYESYPGQSSIMCVERDAVANKYLHCSGLVNEDLQSARVMFYTAGANGPSAWYIRPAETINVELTQVGDEAWASAVLPVDVVLTEGVKAYTGELDEADGVLRLTELTGTVPAGKPVVLAGTAGVKALRVRAAQAPVSVDESGALKGSLRYVGVTDETRDSYLILGIYDEAVGFYLPAEATTAIPGNKAYLDNAAGTAVRGYVLSLGGETTGIEGVTDGSDASEAPLYDLSGRRVVKPTHGVYIRGGKKVYIK